MIHAANLPHFGDNWPAIAGEIGDLSYDALTDFLVALSEKMEKDAEADDGRGRPQLANELYATAAQLRLASKHAAKAWAICAPQMGTAANDALSLPEVCKEKLKDARPPKGRLD